MRYCSLLAVFLANFLIPTITTSQSLLNEIAPIVFPAGKMITTSQLAPLTSSELKAIQHQIELLNQEGCLYLIKMNIDGNNFKELLQGFKKFDISGDGIDDLIFSSPCASEEMKNHFWVKKDNKYYYVGLTPGTLELYSSDHSKPLTIITGSGGGTGSSFDLINLYTPSITDGRIKYKLKKQVEKYISTTFPEKRMYEKSFIVKNDKYNLRHSPVIDDKYNADESDFEGTAVYGNTLAKFAKESKGTAIAEKIDDAGRVWWFVIMDEDAKTTYSRFYSGANVSTMGWMSSRFLKVIK